MDRFGRQRASGALWLGSESVWAEYRDKLVNRTWPDYGNEGQREKVRQLMLGWARDLELGQGEQVRIPAELLNLVGIQRQISWKVVGRGLELLRWQ